MLTALVLSNYRILRELVIPLIILKLVTEPNRTGKHLINILLPGGLASLRIKTEVWNA